MEITDHATDPAKKLTSQGLILQGYCNSVLVQPGVDFTGFKNLKTHETAINDGLAKAKKHSDEYLSKTQKLIISNLSNIANYYELNNAIPIVCPPGKSKEEWLTILGTLKEQADTHKQTSSNTATLLTSLNTELGTDATSFNNTVTKMNIAVNGDNGALIELEKTLSSIDGKIAGCISGTVISGLAIVGGVFMVAVGSIAEFVTAGTSTPLVLGGIAIVSAGIGGEIASAITLSNFLKQKENILMSKNQLKSEVTLAQGISTAYGSLSMQVTGAMNAATAMSNGWNSLSSDLDSLANDLQSGIISTDTARLLFLTASNNLIPTIKQDINTIKYQMAGVNIQHVANYNLSDYLQKLAKAS